MSGVATAPRARPKRAERARPRSQILDAATQYATDVLDGKHVVGEKVRAACKRHLEDLRTGHLRGLAWDVDEAEDAISFFPAAMRHWQGQTGPVVLEPWQRFVIGSAFGWQRWDERRQRWRRRFRLVYVEIGKKNGKTLLAAGVGIRLAFFDDEPGAKVYSAATTRDQAKLSWSDALRAVRSNPDLKKRIKIALSTSVLYNEETGSQFAPLSRDSDTSQGINPHGAIIDELHVHPDRDLYDNIDSAMASRTQPMMFVITTAGVRRTSIWWDIRTDVLRVVEGVVEDDGVFGYVATLDDADDPWDPANWPKANPNLGHSVFLDELTEAATRAERVPSAQTAFFRFRLNLPVSAAIKGLDLRAWDSPGNTRAPEPQPGWGCYAGLDLASVRDLTALVLLFRDPEGHYHVQPFFWCPEEGIHERSKNDNVPYETWARQGYLTPTPGDITDYAAVRTKLEELALVYQIGEIAYDPWNATQLVTELQWAGANVVPVPQSFRALSPPWREVERLVLEGMLRHGGHPILRWMAENVELLMDPEGNVRPSKRVSSERIDGMVALTMAVSRFLTWGAAPGVGYAT